MSKPSHPFSLFRNEQMCYNRSEKGGGAMDRIILHCDLNSFYASVELLDHPELRDRPVAVCGDPNSRHGIILAKNEPAKRYKVQTAETIWQAKKKCPNLVLLPAHHKLYREYSNKVNAIYDEYTDLAESFGIDESWLDVTNTLHLFGGDAKALANAIRQRVKRELGLTLSVGVSFNKVFAKLGSDYKKPDATTVISRENWRSIVWPLPVGDLLYVGGAAQKLLGQYGVKTIGQLAACKKETLTIADTLYDYVKKGKAKIFEGEIRDKDGLARVGAGATLDDMQVLAMDYLVYGVTYIDNIIDPVPNPTISDLIVKKEYVS